MKKINQNFPTLISFFFRVNMELAKKKKQKKEKRKSHAGLRAGSKYSCLILDEGLNSMVQAKRISGLVVVVRYITLISLVRVYLILGILTSNMMTTSSSCTFFLENKPSVITNLQNKFIYYKEIGCFSP